MKTVIIDTDRGYGYGRDFDVLDDGSWVRIFEKSGSRRQVVTSNGTAFGPDLNSTISEVRFLGKDRLFIVDDEVGGHIFTLDGEHVTAFEVGYAIQDVVVLDDYIVLTYFDEGVFSGHPISQQGLAVFTSDGRYEWGYASTLESDEIQIDDCYCAAAADGQTVVFSSYGGFPLVRLNVATRAQDIQWLPRRVVGASAVSVHGDRVFLYSSYDEKGRLLEWKGGSDVVDLGSISGPLRGITRGRFLQTLGNKVAVIDPGAA